MKDPEFYTGRPSKWFFSLPIWKKIAAARSSSVVRTTLLPAGSYIFAAHPHGVLPFGICLNIGTNASDINILFPRVFFRGVAVSCCYIIPFYRDFCLALGGTDCRASTIHNLLQNGCSPLVLPGGADESLLTISHKNRIIVKHKGFIRLAIQTGTPIVPMYSFGENNLWDIKETSKPIQWLNEVTKSILGIRIPPISHLLPHNTQITTVFGSPIPVKKCENPSEEMVLEIHKKYVDQIKELFAKYKPEGEDNLEIYWYGCLF